ncbi:MAG TPA: hypothetical protein VHE35_01705 [Kofleriaceae bacterium]|nr:hypothetical protein [Kofleriaceae bacterium]
MAAIDTPPGLGHEDSRAAGFAAPRGPRRLAEAAMRVTLGLAVVVVLVAGRRHSQAAPVLIAWAVSVSALGLVGAAVRRARVTISADGIRWGWGGLTVRMSRARIVRCDVYADGIALRARRGSTWFLARRDWDRFDSLARAVGDAGLPVASLERKAPFAARLQSYGRILDGLLVAAMVAALAVALVALG